MEGGDGEAVSCNSQHPTLGNAESVAEARKAGMVSSEAATLIDIPYIKQAGSSKGNWLTRKQAKGILAVTDRTKLKGKRDNAILSLLMACAVRRTGLAQLDIATISSGNAVGCWRTSNAKEEEYGRSRSRFG